MELLRAIDDLRSVPGPICLAIGVFDGVHMGHQAVIQSAVDTAIGTGEGNAVVVTFDPHPIRVLRPQDAPRLLTATKHKIELLERLLGIEYLLVVPFDFSFSRWPAVRFIEALTSACEPLKQISVGAEWSFGYERTGDLELLQTLGERLGFEVTGVTPVEADGEVVSSSAIRVAVQAGDFGGAARLLGREYTVLGTVIEGRKLGRELGFPTANLTVHNEEFPPLGVYAVRVRIGNREVLGVGNLGHRPTVTGGEVKRMLEVHLFDLREDLYGMDLEVEFVTFLRAEEKFESLDALKAQIVRDAAAARKAFE
ncbi:MAG: bifunctional riboflavin kinase/FAD synthetase [Verrucomicrobiota bacterium]